MESIDDFMTLQKPTALRPLLGLTVLLVEDSRYASEAMRMMCLKSGARIRRADSVTHARRHLAVYRPAVMIVDVGLPDESGLSLIESLAQGSSSIDVILGISGDSNVSADVLRAGAHGFLAKPISSIAAFQSAILQQLPKERQPPGPRLISDEMVNPDMVAFRDDLTHVADVLGTSVNDRETLDYATQFLRGVAQSVNDDVLYGAVTELTSLRDKGQPMTDSIQRLTTMVQERLDDSGPI